MKFLSLAAAAASAGLFLLSSSVNAATTPPALAGPKPYTRPIKPATTAGDNTPKQSKQKFEQLQKATVFPKGYIIELDDSSSSSKRDNPHAEVHDHLARRAKDNYQTRYEWNDPQTFVGLSVVLDNEDDYDAILSAPNVKRVYRNNLYSLPAFQPVVASTDFVKGATGIDAAPAASVGGKRRRDQPNNAEQGFVDTFSPHVMTGVDKAHAKGFLGKGQTVAVIDTGIDYTHPALGGKPGYKPCFGKGCKVVGGYDLVGDAYNGTNSPNPDSDPFANCEGSGHGTHVAGTIAAQDTTLGFTGVAPHANLTSYRVFGCGVSSAADDVIISAMQRAYFDGNDVLSLSLGGPGGFAASPSAVVASRINALGTPVVLANGNDGAYGAYYASSPAVGLGVTSVGSVNNVNLTGYTADLVPNTLSRQQITYLAGRPFSFDSGASKVLEVYPVSSSLTVTDDGCNPLPDSTPDLSDKVVLVGRGTCLFATKFANINAKGGKYVFVYNTPPPASITYVESSVEGQQAASLTREDGLYLKEQINAGNKVSIDFSNPTLSTKPDTTSGGIMSDFSTYTLSYEDRLLPVVSAPGGNILSTWPVALGSYSIISGTSMATPFMSGSYAVYRSAHGGKTSPDTLRNVFASTGTPLLNATSNAKYLETLSKQGAGLVNVDKALFQQVTFTPQSLELNDTAHFKGTHEITLTNSGKMPTIYKVSHIPAGTTQSQEDSSIFFNLYPVPLSGNFASVSFSQKTIIVPPKGTAKFSATFMPPNGVKTDKLPVYSGYIHLEPQTTGYSGVNISYAGVKSDLSKVQVIDNTDELFGTNLPVLVAADGETFIEQDGTTYSLSNTEAWPQFVYRFNFGTPFYQIDLVKSDTDFKPTYANDASSASSFTGAANHKRFIHRRRPQKATPPETKAGDEPVAAPGQVTPTAPKKGSKDPKDGKMPPPPKEQTKPPSHNSGGQGLQFSQVETVGMVTQGVAVGRNSATGALSDYSYNVVALSPQLTLPQNGSTTLTPGSYRLLLRAQRVFTAGQLESDYESYLSHSFTITN